MTGQLSLTDIEVVVDPLGAAVAWKLDNPDAYEAIVALARDDQENGCKPAIDLYVNLLRRPHMAAKLGLRRSDSSYLINNNLRSQIARLVMREHPAIVFEIRHSSFDEPQTVNATPGVRP